MDHIFRLEDLDIIGCNEVPVTEPAMPRVLSPIFALRNSGKVLFPPYTLGEQEVIRPEHSTREEFDDLVACGEISAWGAQPALPEHELWLDDLGNLLYEPAWQVRGKLNSIFDARLKGADLALKSASLEDTRTHAMVAYSANPRSLEPLIYRAAAEHRMSSVGSSAPSRDELALTEIIAATHIPTTEFQELYQKLARESLLDSTTNPSVAPTQETLSKLSLAATKKPKPAACFS